MSKTLKAHTDYHLEYRPTGLPPGILPWYGITTWNTALVQDYHMEYRPGTGLPPGILPWYGNTIWNTARVREYHPQSHYITVIIGSLHYRDVRRDSGKAAIKVLLLEYPINNIILLGSIGVNIK